VRIRQVVGYVLDHFDQNTRRREHYTLGERRVHGFNSLFATASIDAAKRYYNAFAKAQLDLPEAQRLKIGLIFSYAANETAGDDYLDEEGFDTAALDASSRDFLEDAIQDYNAMFGTKWDTSTDGFAG